MPGDRGTSRQLAQLSGVSIGTVSRALNGYADVRPETRERIVRLARELEYTPAAAARSLKTQRSHVIGVFLETGEGHPDLQHPFFHEVLVGLKNAIGAGGYDLLLFASERPGNGYGTHSYLKRARHHNVAGVVLMGASPDDPEVRRLVRSDLPTVGVDVELEGPATTYVISDNADGAARAVRHFHDLGHRRIATIAGLLETRPGIDRLRGYRQALQACGLAYRDEYVAYGDFYGDSGRRAMAELMALDEPPTAVFAASDMMALGAIRAAADAGRPVP
jgi:LacI family transcriptional regulator